MKQNFTEESLSAYSGAIESERIGGEDNSIKRGMTQPEWATELISEACILKGRRTPKVQWYKRSEFWSSGRAYSSGYKKKWRARGYRNFQKWDIHITLGTSGEDGKQVLCHELAHFFGRPKWHHNKRFWLLLKELLDYFDINTESYKSREAQYKSNSINYL